MNWTDLEAVLSDEALDFVKEEIDEARRDGRNEGRDEGYADGEASVDCDEDE